MKHLIHSQDIDKQGYDSVFRLAAHLVENGIPRDVMEGRVVATLFFRPSTRTMMSFQSAMIRAGGGWIGITSEQASSVAKGESLEDTVRTVSSYADLIVLRHPENDAAERASEVSLVPVINGGSGLQEHASSAATMLFRVLNNLKRPLDHLCIGIYGTPATNRCCNALIPVMAMYGMSLFVHDVNGEHLQDKLVGTAISNGFNVQHAELDDFIGQIDALIVTPALQIHVGTEPPASKDEGEYLKDRFVPIGLTHMGKLRSDSALLMIPPRIWEIAGEVDQDSRAVYSKKDSNVEVYLSLMMYLLGINQ